MTAENKRANNQVFLTGEVVSPVQFDHTVFGEDFYCFDLRVKRLRGSDDILPVVASNRLLAGIQTGAGAFLTIAGQFRSYNDRVGEATHVRLSIFARDLWPATAEECSIHGAVNIQLNGYVCKTPVFRKTPLSREITDLMVAVNRPYGQTDYIPCICWGDNAHLANTFGVGTNIQLEGRIQSRNYRKQLPSGDMEWRVAYEVSVSTIL